MLQLVLGTILLVAGFFELIDQSWIPGLVLFVLGVGIFNGGRFGVWISFHICMPERVAPAEPSTNDGGNSGGDGIGDSGDGGGGGD